MRAALRGLNGPCDARERRSPAAILAALLGTAVLALAGLAAPAALAEDGSSSSVRANSNGDSASVEVGAEDRHDGTEHYPSGRVDVGTGSPTLFECDIFYMGPDGSIWTPWDCVPDNPLVSEGVIYHGTADIPPLFEAPFVQTMIREMRLQTPRIDSTPQDTGTAGAVGLPVWFWAGDPGPTTTGPNRVSATAGRMTVTAVGTMTGLTIRTGDGESIECPGGGTPYPGTGTEPSPDCGHTYAKTSETQPGGVYTVEFTARWSIEWDDSAGHHTVMPLELEGSKELRIEQLESVRSGSR